MSDNERKAGEESGRQEPWLDEDALNEPIDQSPQDERIQELERELEAAKTKAEENWNEFLRSRAELENVRRRAERDVANARKTGVEKLATELLAVRDSLEMGLSAAREANADVAKLTEGSELTLKMLTQAMDKFSIQEVNPLGQRFNPEEHEAMAMQPSAEHEPNTVIHVVQKGYKLSDRLLRPAMVVVSRAADQQQGGHIDEQA
ncbi:MAG: nucleotide exchange factor GrpE [Ectothiorhodospiraceae bacterium]|nr:nucleotide exchange factor GrpE [Ectothiorhodospiraceae bacterium]MCH8506087.1 nucleotide exchange factor GrpE [Ectothiorhodospiraceae bacterium]